MGIRRAVDPPGETRRRQAAGRHAGRHERRDVHPEHRLPMAVHPKRLPRRSTLHDYFTWWHCDGTLDRIHHALYIECREKAEREASPTACIIDSQSVKSAEKGGPALILTGSMRAN